MIIPAIWHEREKQSLFLFLFFLLGPWQTVPPYPFSFLLPPRYILSQGAKQSKLGLGLSHRIEDFETMLTGEGRGGRHWALYIKLFHTDRQRCIDHIDRIRLADSIECRLFHWTSLKVKTPHWHWLRPGDRHWKKTQSGNWKCWLETLTEADYVAGLQFRA